MAYFFCLGPSGLGASAPPRSRGRPTIGPHQRTDLYGLAPVIYNTTTGLNEPEGPSGTVNVVISFYSGFLL